MILLKYLLFGVGFGYVVLGAVFVLSLCKAVADSDCDRPS